MEGRYIKIIPYLILYHIASAQLEKGDQCINNNEPGVCMSIKDCPSAIEKLKRNIHPQTCCFEKTIPIVCCETNKYISDKKCREYGEELKKRNKRQDDDLKVGVVGGTDAIMGIYPHMAGLGYGPIDNIQWLCGGSLISHKFILTAAHCLNQQVLGPVSQIRLGDVNLDGTAGVHKDYQISRRIPHPEYKPPLVYNDIALLELNQRVEFTANIKPACLYSNHKTSHLLGLTATGWGLTQFGGNSSNTLQEVFLNLFSQEECNTAFKKNPRKLPDGIRDHQQICYGGRDVEKDTCNGDSGGPLQEKNAVVDLFNVVGVTSIGKACGTANIPAIYTRVSYYIPWIESIVWP